MAFSKISALATTLAGLTLLLSTACGIGSGGKMVGSGPLVSNDRILTAFNEIEVDGPINLTILQGSTQRVNVSAQLDVQPLLTTVVKGNTLSVTLKGNVDPNVNTNVAITLAELGALSNAGSGSIRVEGFSGKKLSVEAEGSGNLEFRNVRYDAVKSSQEGSGNTTFAGEGDELEISVSGSGDFLSSDFSTNEVEVTSKGSGEVRVVANSTLKIELSGSGNVYYRGNPKLELTDKGSGEARAEN